MTETVIMSLKKKEKPLFDNRGIPYGKVKDGSGVATLDFYMVRSGRCQSSLSLFSLWLPRSLNPLLSLIINTVYKINYVNKSYQRLAFLGEAIVELFVSIFVYENNPYEMESNLHKMRICGINHHIISLIAFELKFHDCLLSPGGGGFKTDIKNYTNKLQMEGIKWKINSNFLWKN